MERLLYILSCIIILLLMMMTLMSCDTAADITCYHCVPKCDGFNTERRSCTGSCFNHTITVHGLLHGTSLQ